VEASWSVSKTLGKRLGRFQGVPRLSEARLREDQERSREIGSRERKRNREGPDELCKGQTSCRSAKYPQPGPLERHLQWKAIGDTSSSVSKTQLQQFVKRLGVKKRLSGAFSSVWGASLKWSSRARKGSEKTELTWEMRLCDGSNVAVITQ
jgi:hypothetical protein